jgi:hypothetical protein
VAATAGPQRGRTASATGRWWFGRRGGRAPEREWPVDSPLQSSPARPQRPR